MSSRVETGGKSHENVPSWWWSDQSNPLKGGMPTSLKSPSQELLSWGEMHLVDGADFSKYDGSAIKVFKKFLHRFFIPAKAIALVQPFSQRINCSFIFNQFLHMADWAAVEASDCWDTLNNHLSAAAKLFTPWNNGRKVHFMRFYPVTRHQSARLNHLLWLYIAVVVKTVKAVCLSVPIKEVLKSIFILYYTL